VFKDYPDMTSFQLCSGTSAQQLANQTTSIKVPRNSSPRLDTWRTKKWEAGSYIHKHRIEWRKAGTCWLAARVHEGADNPTRWFARDHKTLGF
jgi:hypothetical protein